MHVGKPMNRRPFFVLLALLIVWNCRALAGSVAELDSENGLPDAQIGAPLASFHGLEKTEDVGRWLTFKRPSDSLRFGRFTVTGITYNFFKERLYSINLDLQGKNNIKGIIKLLEQEYGKDHTMDLLPYEKVSAMMEVREWAGAKVYCVLKNGADQEGGVLTLLDKPTWDALQVPRKEKLNAAKQLLGGSFLDGTAGQVPATQSPGEQAPAGPAPAVQEPAGPPSTGLFPFGPTTGPGQTPKSSQ